MRFKILSVMVTSIVVVWSIQLSAATDEQYNSIKALGELNGVALHCRYLEETQRMKKGLVDSLPKRRELGLAFDEETNHAFLAFIQNKNSCPDRTLFSQQVDLAIIKLDTVFTAK